MVKGALKTFGVVDVDDEMSVNGPIRWDQWNFATSKEVISAKLSAGISLC